MPHSRFFTPDHEIFRKGLRKFVDTELRPNIDAWEEAELFDRSVFTRMGELGYFGINYPESMGGSAADVWYTVILCEELSRCGAAGLPMAMLVQSHMATPIIGKIGTQDQIETFLMPAIRGEKIAALGVTEPGCGSDVAGMRTTARRDGDDWVINGSKMWITNGTRADFITLAARTSDSRHGGISLFTFPTDVAGFQVSRKLKKLGNKCSDTAVLYFEDCRIPARYLLGEEGHGFYHIMTNFQGERLVGAIMGVAGAQHALDETVRYCRERQAFGRPLTGFQINRHKIVDLETQIEAGRRLAYYAAERFEESESEAVREISMAKLFCAEVAKRVVDECLQLHGGMGYADETPISRAFRDVRLLPIGGGTSEVMKEILSKLMGLG